MTFDAATTIATVAVVATSVLLCFVPETDAFTSPVLYPGKVAGTQTEGKGLHMAVPSVPPMIIGPMIKRMRENQQKKNGPMVLDEEQDGEAPGLRVGNTAWKWPPIWPYDDKMFMPPEDVAAPQRQDMTTMLKGSGPAPVEEKEPMKALDYWGIDKAETLTELDSEAVENLQK